MTEEMDTKALLGLIADGVRQTALHYGLWFAETVHHCGLEKALEAEKTAGDAIFPLYMKRLSKILGFELEGDLPKALAGLDREDVARLAEGVAVNWLAVDGLWFQAVENLEGMDAAKRCNDTCWTRFAPIEASHIRSRLGLPEPGGIPALRRALEHRLYGRINSWEIVEETATSLVFRMNQCRVQNARKRKGLPDYPCKSGGMAEYIGFARQIDPRLVVTCLGCPPDPHPEEWFCSWRFAIE
ncbi:MAG: DUF6125 family protein [Desulfovibrionaceae bacterium]